MWSFVAGALAVDGAESGRWGEALLGGALAGSSNNTSWTSAIGGGLFADGVRHHNMTEEIGGLALGVLGASNSSNTHSSHSYYPNSCSPPSYHHYHHYHHETAAERNEREEREHLALLAEQQRAEERRIVREEAARREKKARLTEIAEENKNQADRSAIHMKHNALITSAKTLAYDDLKKEIKSIEPLPVEYPRYRRIICTRMGFPESKTENIYSSILSNRNLSSDNKLDVINSLQRKGYFIHEARLIRNPAIGLLLRENSPAMILKMITAYNSYLANCEGRNLENERDLWKKIRDIQPGQITETLRNVIRFSRNHQKPIQFAIDWINSINSPIEIMTAQREIDRIFKATKHLSLSDHTDTILKFAKQRILNMTKNNEAKEGHTAASDVDKGRVELFLNRHRGWHLCFQRTKSKVIYDELRNKSRGAHTLLDEEDKKIDSTLSKLQVFRQ